MDKTNQQTEQEIYHSWEKAGLFRADPASSKKPYSLLMPPPNLTGELHLGHAMQHSILDALARFKRMQGFDVLLMPGVDHASIQFESALNKILAKEGLSKYKLGKEAWMKRAWQFKDEIYASFHKDWTVFGISADWSREVFTLDEKRSQAVYEQFKKYYDDGLVYKGAYIVQWCPKCGTAIEDVEMEYEERKEKLYFVKYKIEGTNDYIIIATGRPETIYADTGIATYSNHPKFAKFIGKNAANPLNGNKIPIFEDKQVDKAFGTGALKITPGHDPLDFKIGKDNSLPILHAIDKTGKMTDLAGDLVGLKIEEARKLAVEKLEQLGAIEKIEEYIHSVPVCERCKTTVEPLISEEWFIKMKPLADKALKRIGEVNFLPENYKKILTDWIKDLHDWCISRDLWWGHRIPIWYHGDQIKVSQDSPGAGWEQEEKIFDTWFSSGMWPLSTLEWSFDFTHDKPVFPEEFKKYFPWDFEITAPEIKYLWIARMIMISLYLTNEIPFKNMFFHGMLRDLQGKKFSKSLGNGINPNDLRGVWGTDSVRMALYSYSAPGRDGKTSRQIMDERCKNFRNFGTKIKNIYKFIYELKPEGAIKSSDFSHVEDTEIIQFLNGTVSVATKHLENYQLHLAIEELYDFIWNKFASSYIEWSKKRRPEAQPCLEHVFETCLKLLHPFMPFTTEELWQKINKDKKSIMESSWPIDRA